MRSLKLFRSILTVAAAFMLVGCLVSETPVLDQRTGKARVFSDGEYLACPLENGEIKSGADCDRLNVQRENDGAYRFVDMGADDNPAILRFRRIGRGGYAVQSSESDGQVYFYGDARGNDFLLVMMNCPDLPAALRDKLIMKGDLDVEDGDFTVCEVKTVKGLVEAAKAYHRDDVVLGQDAAILISPAPAIEMQE